MALRPLINNLPERRIGITHGPSEIVDGESSLFTFEGDLTGVRSTRYLAAIGLHVVGIEDDSTIVGFRLAYSRNYEPDVVYDPSSQTGLMGTDVTLDEYREMVKKKKQKDHHNVSEQD